MPDLVFVDTETTGLDSSVHEMYEVALTKTDLEGELKDSVYYWIVPQRLHLANPQALTIGNYYNRKKREPCDARIRGTRRREIAEEIAVFTQGVHLVGCNPHFDANFIAAFLKEEQHVPVWHHRMIDLESMAIGIEPDEAQGVPMGLTDLCECFDVVIPDEDRHTAQGDVEATRELYFRMIGLVNVCP